MVFDFPDFFRLSIIFFKALKPTFLIALRPKDIVFSSIALKLISDSFTSGAFILIFNF